MPKIITWNVNSIRIRIDDLEKLVKEENPDLVCLQEVKAKEQDFPFDEIKRIGFEHIALYSMAGYNGVAILSKTPLSNITRYDWCQKSDARHIAVGAFDDWEIHNIYVPAGGGIAELDQPAFIHKLNFVDELTKFFGNRKENYKNKKLLICGDFNIAPLENDVWNHKQMLKTISHTPIEIEKLDNLYNSLPFCDQLRRFYPEPQKLYSWWSYRNPNWQTNDKGRRLDHIWCSNEADKYICSAKILKEFRSSIRPSDHVPVVVEF